MLAKAAKMHQGKTKRNKSADSSLIATSKMTNANSTTLKKSALTFQSAASEKNASTNILM